MNRRQKHISLFLPCLLLTALLSVCSAGHSPVREKLDDANRLTESNPDSAIAVLEAFSTEGLSEADRNYLNLLTIKARDKAYVTHTSDSLILSVIDYYSRHSSDKSYPEALYYGGRVYSDLGDLPTAIQYYHTALDILPPETDNKSLRAKVLSQTGRLLNTLRLHDQAFEYIRKAIEIDSILRDSANMMYDNQLLGSIKMHSGKYDNAEILFRKAREIALNVDSSAVPLMDMYLAAAKYYKGENDSALSIIRDVVDRVDSVSLDAAIGYASMIYLKSNIPDTALMYGQQLIAGNSYNREAGYRVILSPKLKGYIHHDSIYDYITHYRDILEESFNQNESQKAIMQESLYNYRMHEKERIRIEKENERLRLWLSGMVILVVSFTAAVFYRKYRKRGEMLRSYLTIDRLKELRMSFMTKSDPIDETPVSAYTDDEDRQITPVENNPCPAEENANMKSMGKRICDELFKVLKECPDRSEVSPVILNSEAYSDLLSYIEKEKVISEKNYIWKKIEDVILTDSDNFKYRLNLMTGKNLKTIDYNMILLIKCGMSPTQVAILLGRSKSAVSYRRSQLSICAFGQKLESKQLDNLIRCL